MTKRALVAVAGFLGCCLSLSAQTPEQLLFDNVSLSRPYTQVPSLNLADQDRFFFSTAFGGIQPTSNFLPDFQPQKTRPAWLRPDRPGIRL